MIVKRRRTAVRHCAHNGGCLNVSGSAKRNSQQSRLFRQNWSRKQPKKKSISHNHSLLQTATTNTDGTQTNDNDDDTVILTCWRFSCACAVRACVRVCVRVCATSFWNSKMIITKCTMYVIPTITNHTRLCRETRPLKNRLPISLILHPSLQP